MKIGVARATLSHTLATLLLIGCDNVATRKDLEGEVQCPPALTLRILPTDPKQLYIRNRLDRSVHSSGIWNGK